MGRAFRRSIAAFVAGLALGCSSVQPVPERPLDDETVRAARERVAAFAAARDDVELVEGGIWMEGLTVQRDPYAAPYPLDPRFPIDPWHPSLPPLYDMAPLEVLSAGSGTIPWRRLQGVRVHRWPLGTGIELDVAGVPQPIVLRVDDAEAAPLAEALDVMRRAQAPISSETPAP